MRCCVHPCVRDAVGTTVVQATFDMPITDEALVHMEWLAGVRGLYGVALTVGFCAGHCDLLGIDVECLDEVPA